ncbi:hypothetical protein ACHAPJ_012148 [Fusarium lateritium]
MPHTTSPHIQEAIEADEYVKIILCFDGTGNTFSGTNADTNVVKILRRLDRNHKNQYHYYQTGIGTYDINESSVNKSTLGEIKSKFTKAIDSGFGTTFDAHVMAGYRFLMRYYEPEAKIYIFGFSRGAYTARYLSRMVNKVGLLCKGNEEMVPFAYKLYQTHMDLESKDRTAAFGMFAPAPPDEPCDQQTEDASLTQNGGPNGAANGTAEPEQQTNTAQDHSLAGNRIVTKSDKTEAAEKQVKAFSQTFCRTEGTDPKVHVNIKVFFLGLWDCVNSVAVVENSAPAPVEVTGTAHHVRHAVAVDERRVKFKPALLAQDIKKVVKDAQNKDKSTKDEEDIREVWFPGNHGDIGGGWPAMAQQSPSELAWWPRLKFIFRTIKQDKLDKPLEDTALQMSDMALEWMIREVDIVGKQHPGCGVHWCHTLSTFRDSMKEANKVEQHVVKGFIHDCLRFGYGPNFFKVIMWNLIESLPGIPRWELNDSSDEMKRGWDLYKAKPNWCASRDIPRGAVMHNSLKERLEKVTNYRPRNNHGAGKPCLWDDKGRVPMKDVTYQRFDANDEEIVDKDWDERHTIWQFEDFYNKSHAHTH